MIIKVLTNEIKRGGHRTKYWEIKESNNGKLKIADSGNSKISQIATFPSILPIDVVSKALNSHLKVIPQNMK